MPELDFHVVEANVVPFAAVPTIAFKLKVENAAADEAIHTIVLRAQIQIEVARRRYTTDEQHNLADLFGAPDRWNQTLRSMLWTQASVIVPAFQGKTTVVDLQVPCTFDFNVATTKYFDGLTGGDLPLHFLFSGTVFYAPPHEGLQVAPVPWDREARFSLPVKVWQDMMNTYYPNTVWINLRRDVFERLHQYKMQRGIPTWEQALESVLPTEVVVRR